MRRAPKEQEALTAAPPVSTWVYDRALGVTSRFLSSASRQQPKPKPESEYWGAQDACAARVACRNIYNPAATPKKPELPMINRLPTQRPATPAGVPGELAPGSSICQAPTPRPPTEPPSSPPPGSRPASCHLRPSLSRARSISMPEGCLARALPQRLLIPTPLAPTSSNVAVPPGPPLEDAGNALPDHTLEPSDSCSTNTTDCLKDLQSLFLDSGGSAIEGGGERTASPVAAAAAGVLEQRAHDRAGRRAAALLSATSPRAGPATAGVRPLARLRSISCNDLDALVGLARVKQELSVLQLVATAGYRQAPCEDYRLQCAGRLSKSRASGGHGAQIAALQLMGAGAVVPQYRSTNEYVQPGEYTHDSFVRKLPRVQACFKLPMRDLADEAMGRPYRRSGASGGSSSGSGRHR